MPYDEQGNYIADYLQTRPLQGLGVPQAPPTSDHDLTVGVHHYIGDPDQTLPRQEYVRPDVQQQFPQSERYQQLLSTEPKLSDYHPSGMRNFGSVIGGMAEGIAHGTPAGQATEELIRNKPLNRQMAAYQQQLQNAGEGMQAEQGLYKTRTAGEENIARRRAEEARAGAEEARRQEAEFNVSPEGFQRKLQIAQVEHPGAKTEPYKIMDKAGNVHIGSWQGTAFKDTNGVTIPEDQIDLDKTQKLDDRYQKLDPFTEWAKDPANAALPNKTETWLRLQEAMKPGTQSEYNQFKASYQKKHPNADDTEILPAFARAKQEPARVNPIIGFSGGKAVAVYPGQNEPPGFRNAATESRVGSPTTQEMNRSAQAQVVIDTGRDLENWINQNRDKLGKLGDYWQQIVSGTPVSDPTISEFQTRVASYAALQAAAHQFRGANVMKDFEGKIGGPAKNPDAVISAIHGIESTMNRLRTVGGGGGASNALPGGITLDEINAELARRKGKK